MAYLDNTGLAYFWGKIKAYVAALLAPKANDADVVHKTGNETVGGDKTFTGAVHVDTYIDIKKASFARNTAPSENKTFGSFNVIDSNSNPVTRIYTWYNTNKFLQSGLITYSGINTSYDFTGIFVGFDADGLPFAYTSSTRTDRTTSGDILTRDWIPKDTRIVHTTGDEVISGAKSFNFIRKYDTRLEKGVSPSTRTYYSIDFCDKNHATASDVNGTRLGIIEGYVDPDGSTSFGISNFKYAANAGAISSISCKYDAVNDWPYVETSATIEHRVNTGIPSYVVRHLNRQRTVAPSARRTNVCILGRDANDISLWGLYSVQETDNTSYIRLIEYKSTTTDGAYAYVEVGSKADGTLYTAATTTPDDAAGNEIVTAGWANSKYLRLDNTQQTVLGLKTFTNNIIIKSGAIVSDENPSTTLYSFIQYYSKDGVNVSNAGYAKYSNGEKCYIMYLYDRSGGSTVIKRLSYSYDADTLNATPDNGVSLGSAGVRWKQLYAGTTVISTSDERLKDSISPVPDEVLDAWAGVDFVQFRMKDAVAGKGAAARLHSGMVAQDIQRAFAARGLDASGYGLFCYDSWDAKEALKDESGKILDEALPAGDRYSLRYEEALCMEAAYMRRENARLKERMADLEERLAALELKVS